MTKGPSPWPPLAPGRKERKCMGKISKIDKLLDFSVRICREMLESGANLERVSISLQRISRCYLLRDVSVVVANNVMILSIKDPDGIS